MPSRSRASSSRPRATVPDREGEHALELLDDAVALFLVQVKDGFGVAPAFGSGDREPASRGRSVAWL